MKRYVLAGLLMCATAQAQSGFQNNNNQPTTYAAMQVWNGSTYAAYAAALTAIPPSFQNNNNQPNSYAGLMVFNTTTNSWQPWTGASSSGSGTVNTGTTNAVPKYTASGTTVGPGSCTDNNGLTCPTYTANGTFNNTAPIVHVGTNGSMSAGTSLVETDYAVTLSGGGTHAYADANAITGSAGVGYASFYAAATIAGSADHFNGYQSRQTALTGASIGSYMQGYESRQVIQAGASATSVYDYQAEENDTGTTGQPSTYGTVGIHYGFHCDPLFKATTNWCFYSAYTGAYIGEHLEVGGDTGGGSGGYAGAGTVFRKGSSAYFASPNEGAANTIVTDSNGVLDINGNSGGLVAVRTGSYLAVCPVGTNSYSCNGLRLSVAGVVEVKENAAVASAATIAPLTQLFHLTGTTSVSTMTPPAGMDTSTGAGKVGGALTFIADAATPFTAGTGYGQFSSSFTTTAGVPYTCWITPSTGLWYCK